jgi:hypothetical protein
MTWADKDRVVIPLLPIDEEAEQLVDELFTKERQAREPVTRRELKRAYDASILDEVYAPKK